MKSSASKLKKRIARHNLAEGEANSSDDSSFESASDHDQTKHSLDSTPSKRQKQSVHDSLLFSAYRSLGHYTSTLPLSIYKSGED